MGRWLYDSRAVERIGGLRWNTIDERTEVNIIILNAREI